MWCCKVSVKKKTRQLFLICIYGEWTKLKQSQIQHLWMHYKGYTLVSWNQTSQLGNLVLLLAPWWHWTCSITCLKLSFVIIVFASYDCSKIKCVWRILGSVLHNIMFSTCYNSNTHIVRGPDLNCLMPRIKIQWSSIQQ